MMNAELKTKWLTALRSGDYMQTGGALKKTNMKQQTSFCCLGVLCDVMGAKWDGDIPARNDVFMNRGGDDYLSDDVLDEVGFSNHEQLYLANLNDIGKSFEEIANHIEAKL